MNDGLPLVIQLQQKAFDAQDSISTLLRMSKLVAIKLGVEGAREWIEHELNGYEGVVNDDLPKYRKVKGSPRARNPFHGWIPMTISDNDFAEAISTAHIIQSAGALEETIRSHPNEDYLQINYSNQQYTILRKMFSTDFPMAIHLTPASIWAIVDRVRNLVLDWAMALEREGVLGAGMQFSMPERQKGSIVTNNYFANNIGVAGDISGSAQLNLNQHAHVGSIDVAALRQLIAQLEMNSSALPPEVRSAMAPALAALQHEAGQSSPDPSKIRTLLASVRTACEGAAGNLVASGAVELIKALLGG
ncbi:AbiTii domain-containing protein [Rhodovarius crocodyli]|nr:hypothetical protein [Rhodovarius crocodyli]